MIQLVVVTALILNALGDKQLANRLDTLSNPTDNELFISRYYKEEKQQIKTDADGNRVLYIDTTTGEETNEDTEPVIHKYHDEIVLNDKEGLAIDYNKDEWINNALNMLDKYNFDWNPLQITDKEPTKQIADKTETETITLTEPVGDKWIDNVWDDDWTETGGYIDDSEIFYTLNGEKKVIDTEKYKQKYGVYPYLDSEELAHAQNEVDIDELQQDIDDKQDELQRQQDELQRQQDALKERQIELDAQIAEQLKLEDKLEEAGEVTTEIDDVPVLEEIFRVNPLTGVTYVDEEKYKKRYGIYPNYEQSNIIDKDQPSDVAPSKPTQYDWDYDAPKRPQRYYDPYASISKQYPHYDAPHRYQDYWNGKDAQEEYPWYM